MTISVWCEGTSHLWQKRVGTIRKGTVTWCVLSPLPVAWAGIHVDASASGPGSVDLHLLWLLSSCQLLLMTSETSQISGGLHMKCSGHSALREQTVSQPAQDLEALTCLLNWAGLSCSLVLCWERKQNMTRHHATFSHLGMQFYFAPKIFQRSNEEGSNMARV